MSKKWNIKKWQLWFISHTGNVSSQEHCIVGYDILHFCYFNKCRKSS